MPSGLPTYQEENMDRENDINSSYEVRQRLGCQRSLAFPALPEFLRSSLIVGPPTIP